PPYFIQGAGLFFNDYDSENVHSLWNKLRRDLWTLYRGWGFLDDEILGLKQALENAIDRHPLYTRKPDIPADAVAFVVGAGPSLDGLLPVLRAYADKAFIVSCGSAITALARAGIKPDLHVEIERTYMTYVVLDDPQTRDFVKDVPIAALSIMHPAVFTATTKPLMFLKEIDMGAHLCDFFGEYQHFRSGPTCTNGGLDIVLRMGFKRAYLFGIDYGFRDPAQHHSKASIYFDKTSAKSDDLERIVDFTHEAHKVGLPVPGNFSEGILSTEIFIHSRDSMAISVAEHPDAKVFNFNDGAKISGTHPLKDEDLALELDASAKPALVSAAMSAFTDDYDADPFDRLNMLIEQVVAVREDLTRILSGELKSKMDVADKLYDMHHYLFDERHQSAQIFPLVRGSMLHMGRFLYDCMAMIRDEKTALEYARFGFDLFDRFLAAGQENIVSLHELGRARQEAHRVAEHASQKGVAA
ncbi:MAG TPA: 6-hydroxymethylpterin diphosphokinase MptE-like protein, partial [Rhodocyclaceae bacterium]|nr:6-hydroxymethylpterin diphosphokinase MptE-like protein [Rhodocyclaceae bacterium]